MEESKVEFIDNNGVAHNFRYAFFYEDEGEMPPRDLGMYVLLERIERNDGGNREPGTHMVLYVGQSETGGLRNRMFFHLKKKSKSRECYRRLDRWPRAVLFVTDADAEISGRREESLLARRTAYEEMLHGLFVPPCSDKFGEAKRRGAAEGCVPTVRLDLVAGTLEWAR